MKLYLDNKICIFVLLIFIQCLIGKIYNIFKSVVVNDTKTTKRQMKNREDTPPPQMFTFKYQILRKLIAK